MPLLIIAGVVAAVVGITGWQISTALGGVPFWVWVVGGIAVFYLFSQTDTGKKVTSTAGTATKIYLTRGILKNPRYEVEVQQPIILHGRSKPDMVSRYFRVTARTAVAAVKAVRDAGHTGKPVAVTKLLRNPRKRTARC